MKLPKDSWKEFKQRADQWVIPKRLANLQDKACLRCWIILVETVCFWVQHQMMNAALEYTFTRNHKIGWVLKKINTKTLYSKLELYVDFRIFNHEHVWYVIQNWNKISYSMHISLSFNHCMFQHELPSLKGSEEDCIANFVLRKDARISYPGACSLEFQSVMQILTECLLRWDTKT